MINSSDQKDDCSLKKDDQKLVSNLDKYIKDDQMDQPVQQHYEIEARQTDRNNQQVAVQSGFNSNNFGTFSVSV